MADADTIRTRALRGFAYSSASQAVRLMVQIGSVVMLSRLLQPDDFGMIAMVSPAYALAMLLQDFGLSQAAIQAPRLTPGQAGALFYVNVAAGLGLAAGLALAAPALARFYGEPRLAPLTAAFAGIVAVAGLTTQPQAWLNRQMRFRFIAAIDMVQSVAGLAAAIAAALILRNYWAMFVAPAVSAAVILAMSWPGARWRPGWPRRRPGAGALLRFGSFLVSANLLELFVRNVDNVLIGRAWGNTALGVYDRAYKLLLFPLEQVNGPLSRVMLPTLARLAHEPDRYRHAYLRTIGQMLLVSQPGIIFMIGTADTLVPAILGEQWRGSAPVFQWLGLTAVAQPLTGAAGWLMVSQGRARAMMGWGAANAVICAAAFVTGLPWGPAGVAAAYSLSDILLRLPLYGWLATRHGPVGLAPLCRIALPFAMADAASLLAVLALRDTTRWPVLAELASCLLVAYAVTALVLLAVPSGRATLRQSAELVRPLILAVIARSRRPPC